MLEARGHGPGAGVWKLRLHDSSGEPGSRAVEEGAGRGGGTLEVVRVRSEGEGKRLQGCEAGPWAQKSRDGDRRYVLTDDSWQYLTGWAPQG